VKPILSLIIIIIAVLCIGCGSAQGTEAAVPEPQQSPAMTPAAEASAAEQPQENKTESEETETMQMKIGETEVEVVWEDNESAAALKELARDGLAIQMSMYGGFEQVGSIGKSLPREDRQTTTQAGDIVLYSGNQLVVFYGSNSWAYTRLGKIADKSASELSELLGGGDVTITLALK
jgi:hypothetical protein